MRRFVFSLLGILIFYACSAKDIYVDQRVENTGYGTENAPYKTINEAAKVAEAGDVVIINDGVYREYVEPKNNGTPDSPIIFKAKNAGKVVISGADIVTDWVKVDGNEPIYVKDWSIFFLINTNDYTHTDDRWGRADLTVVNGKLMVFCESLQQLKDIYNGVKNKTAPSTPIGNDAWDAPIINDPYSWEGAFYNDIANEKAYIWLKDGKDPNNHTIEMGARKRIFGNYWHNQKKMNYIHVQGIIFRHCPTFPQRPAVDLTGVGNYMEDCIIEANAGGGVHVGGSIKNCIIQRNGHIGGHAFDKNEQTLWKENSWKPINRGWEAGGTKISFANGASFNKCAFIHNGGPGLWFDIDNKDCTVSECVFYENEGSGLFYEISSDVEIFDNLFVRNGVFKVLVEEPHLSWATAGIMIGESYNINMHNNTCVGNKDGIGIRETGNHRFGHLKIGSDNSELPYWCHDIQIKNNLLINNSRKANEKGGLGFGIGFWYATENFGPNTYESEKPDYDQWVNNLESSTKSHDPRTENFDVKDNWVMKASTNRAILFGVPWKHFSQQFNTFEEFESFTSWSNTGKIITEAPFVNEANNNFKIIAGSDAAISNIGWVDAPEDIDAWIRSFIPEYYTANDFTTNKKVYTINKADFFVYPNPVVNSFSLKTDDQIEQLDIYSLTGRLVKRFYQSANNQPYNIQEINPGIYIVEARTVDYKKHIAKIIIK